MEIESKILINKEKYEHLVADIQKTRTFGLDKKVVRKDTYISAYETEEERKANNEPMIRLRVENCQRNVLTVKRKQIKDGVEFNVEKETILGSKEPLLVLFPYTWYEKTKVATGYVLPFINFDVHVEYVEVSVLNKDPVYAVEIEVTDDNVSLETAKFAIKLAFENIGFKDPESQYNNESWRKILDIC